MRLVVLVFLISFTLGDSVSTTDGPAVAVRPDWTDIPQGDRVLPRLNDATPPLDGAKRKEVLFGPYNLTGGSMLSRFVSSKEPCQNCFVTAMQFTARYPDGREVHTTDGVWLHHCLLSSASRRKNYTPYGRNVIWAGGNERPTLRLNTRYKYGIDWPSNFNILLEFMSEIEEDVKVALAFTFEYIEKSQPEAEGYRDSILRWNSIGNPVEKGSYNRASTPWTVPFSGTLVHAMGHMHDGGTHVELYVNDKMVCSSRMYYGRRPGYGPAMAQETLELPGPGVGSSPSPSNSKLESRNLPALHRRSRLGPRQEHSHGGGSVRFGSATHLSDPGHCTSFGRVEKGDQMYMKAYYDTEKHPVMTHDGDEELQMGILRVWIGPDEPQGDAIDNRTSPSWMRERPEGQPFKRPEGQPFKWPKGQPFKLPEGQSFKWPEGQPPPFKWPEGQPPPFKWPDGQPLPFKRPEGQPLPIKSPEGLPKGPPKSPP